jgi:outer membrane PBP1 activator LpoA protein
MSGCQNTSVGGFETSGSLDRGADRKLAGAEERYAAADYNAVLALLQSTDLTRWDSTSRDAAKRLEARTWLALGDPQRAQDALAELVARKPEDYLLIGEICDATGDYRCAADGYIQASLDLGMDHPRLPPNIHDLIWSALSRARQGPAVFTQRYHHGWWLLQQRLRNAGSVNAQLAAWRAWRREFPSHPANIRPPQALLSYDSYRIPKLGVLLPLSGQYASAGLAVRNGLLAAYLSESNSTKPQIVFYDTNANDLGQIWEQQLLDGIEVSVGPLLKADAERFAQLTQTQFSQEETRPRLVLNYLTDYGTAQLDGAPFQFGIAIEDEAKSLTDHILDAGLEKLLVVYNGDRWSSRALATLTSTFPHPLVTASFIDIQSMTEAVGSAMQVAASEQRRNAIADILGTPLEFLPRARSDLDGVVALTNQIEARALIPALRFHFADELPVYATSQSLRGDERAGLRGFRVTEMSVFTRPDPDLEALAAAFNLQHNPLAELYALGFDAYRLGTWLPLLTADSQVSIAAASGQLHLSPGGRFARQLSLNLIDADGRLIAQ